MIGCDSPERTSHTIFGVPWFAQRREGGGSGGLYGDTAPLIARANPATAAWIGAWHPMTSDKESRSPAKALESPPLAQQGEALACVRVCEGVLCFFVVLTGSDANTF